MRAEIARGLVAAVQTQPSVFSRTHSVGKITSKYPIGKKTAASVEPNLAIVRRDGCRDGLRWGARSMGTALACGHGFGVLGELELCAVGKFHFVSAAFARDFDVILPTE